MNGAVELSLVIPAFNEGERLPPFLRRVRSYLTGAYGGAHEVLVVDDGSGDDLKGRIQPLQAGWPQLCYLGYAVNRGKGTAVRTGILEARGRRILFSDADGATPIEEESKLHRAIEEGADIAVGSRLAAGKGVLRKRTWLRDLAGRGFARLVKRFAGLALEDTQCGFKMFRREAGRRLFSSCREPGYLFDVEVLARARQAGYRIAEVPVRWNEMPGSKVCLLRDGWHMAWGLMGLSRSFRPSPPCLPGRENAAVRVRRPSEVFLQEPLP